MGPFEQYLRLSSLEEFKGKFERKELAAREMRRLGEVTRLCRKERRPNRRLQ